MHDQIAKKLLLSGNCVGVLAGGLCESRTVSSVISEFSVQRSKITPLMIVLNQDTHLEETSITGETPADVRIKTYSSGGLVTVTSRVLLSDLLVRRLDPALIDLLVIRSVHAVASDTGNEAFIVRLFREHNGKGLLVCLSDKPHAIAKQLDSLVSIFYLSDIVLFPRFHEIVQRGLEDSISEELQVSHHESPFSVRQTEMQALLVSIVEASLAEIRKCKYIDGGDFLSNSSAMDLMKNANELFAFRRKIEPFWMKLSWNARQIISDLAVIRKLIVALVRYDCVNFHALLVQQKHLSSKSPSPWWFSEAATRLEKLARDRVDAQGLEIPNDWTLIDFIAASQLDDNDAAKRQKQEDKVVKIFIICHDDLAAKQISNFVSDGPKKTLLESRLRSAAPEEMIALKQMIDSCTSEPCPGDQRKNGRCDFFVSSKLEKCDDFLSELLEYLPDAIVLSSPSLVAIRAIEVFRKTSPHVSVHVILHACSVVEASFQDLTDRENKAFDEIIRSKKLSTFHSKDELFTNRARTVNVSSRKGGGKRRNFRVSELLSQRVLVDVRELRSALPFVLYKKGLEIVPCTLSIGDYIVSRDIAIERKSVTGNDLQQSLASGRLYKQLVNLTHAFAWPTLLLEFGTGKAFQLQSSETSTGEINSSSLIAQIIAIIMHFPSVRIVWSPSFVFTANLFSKLKIGREQPRSPETATQDTTSSSASSSSRATEFLKACPGITAANLPSVLKRVKSVRELVQLDESEIVRLLGKRDGNLFLKFIKYQF